MQLDGTRHLILVDTGGVCDLHAAIDSEVERQSLAALRECDLALLLVDARDGLHHPAVAVSQAVAVHRFHARHVGTAVFGDGYWWVARTRRMA